MVRPRHSAIAVLALLFLVLGALPAYGQVNSDFGSAGRYDEPSVEKADSAILSDGTIVLVGRSTASEPATEVRFTRLNPDGSPVEGFGEAGSVLTELAVPAGSHDQIFGPLDVDEHEGSVVGTFATDIGTLVARFGVDGAVEAQSVDTHCGNPLASTTSNGSVYVVSFPRGPEFDTCPGSTVRKYSVADAAKDEGWGNQGAAGFTTSGAHFDEKVFPSEIAADSKGRVLVAGGRGVGGPDRPALVRIGADGTSDAAFDSDGADGHDGYVSFDHPGVFAFLPTFAGGSLGSFTQSHHTKMALDVAVDALDRPLVVGTICPSADASSNCTGQTSVWVARLTTSGALDRDFGTDGLAIFDPSDDDDYGLGVAVDSLNRVFVTGFSRTGSDSATVFAALLNSSGRLVSEFGDGGVQIGGFATTDTESAQAVDITLDGHSQAYVGITRVDRGAFGASVVAYDLPAPSSRFRCTVAPRRNR